MYKKKIVCTAIAVAMGISALLTGCGSSGRLDAKVKESALTTKNSNKEKSNEKAGQKLNTKVKDATKKTKNINAKVYGQLDFGDEREKEFAQRGLLRAPKTLEIKAENGNTAWSQDIYDFVRDKKAPATANPSLWRNTQLNALYGLFEVADGIYQVRGYDVANVTFVRGDKGWIVFDCGTGVETASAALKLFEEEFGKAHISAVVISHAHIDHYGGIGGIISREQTADSDLDLEAQIASGKTLVIVPEGFEKAAMEENVLAGNAMKRRSNFQYGSLIPKGKKGALSVGIGLTVCAGTTSYIAPTYEVKKETEEITVDGVKMVFQLTPGTESPAEMNTYLPDYHALWMAENCTATMHNIYTLRGAEIRDSGAWGDYIMKAKALFAGEAEVVFQSHNWPHWGNDVVNEYMLNTAAVYRYIHSQTLQYINEGYTAEEIAQMIELPDALEQVWYTRQYYGTLAHNAKAVYQKYMGWYDANPVHLNALAPSEYAQKLMEYMGDTDKVLKMAKEDFRKGEYQWVAEITNAVVYAQPDNKEARRLCADALEQLGYQAESGAWRNAYLTGAYELRYGTENYAAATVGGTGASALAMSTETMLDYLAMCLDSKKLEDTSFVINLEVTDENEKYLLRLHHGVLLYSKEKWSDAPDAEIKLKRAGIVGIAQNNKALMENTIESVSGRGDILKVFTDNLAKFDPYFNIIEP